VAERTWLGIDIGTSAVKALVVDADGHAMTEAAEPLAIAHPEPLWSEQDPDAWWLAVEAAVARLANAAPGAFARVGGIGLSGQMHGAVLLGADDRPLRPAILWNDGRAHTDAADLAATRPDLALRLGVKPMAGFVAPKLLWLARHEPASLDRLSMLVLPKDYIRLKLTGEHATDPCDAAGAWLLDEARRDWDEAALAAVGLARSKLPRIVEGSAVSGRLSPEIARRWGLDAGIPVAGGAGDAAAGALGVGAIDEGDTILSLGTSAQLFASTASYRPNVAALVHAFAHALPGRWFQMAAMLNGASALAWAAGVLGRPVGDLVAAVEARATGPSPVTFLPYLTGERTPHDDPHARGVFFGLSAATDALDIARAVMEGVAFTFADARDALVGGGTEIGAVAAVGGGARSRLWLEMIAAVLDRPVLKLAGGDKGPAFGAAMLARLAATGEPPESVCLRPPVEAEIRPDPALRDAYAPRVAGFRRLYAALRPEFAQL
jgi:xylulokinase